MILTTLDIEGLWRRHECEVKFDDTGEITDIRVPFIIKAHIVDKAWLQTPVKNKRISFKNPNLRFGNMVLLDRPSIYAFFKEFGP